MKIQKHVLVVDDHKPFREISETHLVQDGYRVSLAEDGQVMRKIMARDPADLVLVDLTLPRENGLSLIRFLRDTYACGIIVVSARSDLTDRVLGLEVGADDYVMKPYEPAELLARVRSVLRRMEGLPRQPEQGAVRGNGIGGAVASQPLFPSQPVVPVHQREVLAFAHWRFDVAARVLLTLSFDVVELTPGEFNLLNEFVANVGTVLSRERLLQAVHSRNWDYFDRSIDVLITRLRKKMETNPDQPAIIKTVRGAGYLFAPSVENILI